MTSRELHGKRARTRERLVGHALDLFEQQGFEQTTVSQIAARAGVSEMTFFRYFASKDRVVLDDPYDPVIAEAVAGQPATLPPLVRVTRGLRSALAGMDDLENQVARRRVRIVATTPALRAGIVAANAATEAAIADRLIADGVPALPARVAATATLAALTCALLEWATAEERISLTAAVTAALDTMEAGRHD
ncbi:TetR family transcriptional regulator [Micromonospora sp. WMMD1082]|uniref:TetR family transcriptional regulator n=1 Tax=Micromonospora sp. WMMD1082 TaxID=3016104 RepID=UPI0024164B01|nr:TetR family transcriptional regulator [Micromonospora sp. WMMD1082]MDG4798444.1 TetR family transcriptional regulator [Micromonospora sp. WMMD1082]